MRTTKTSKPTERTTRIAVILDRSGSMSIAHSDHEGGLKAFVEDQKKIAGDARFTLVRFDDSDPCEIVYDDVPISKVGTICLRPRGCTPLLDAVGKTLAHFEPKVKKTDQAIVVVITDGLENASKEWKKDQLADRVKKLEKKGWTFIFLGANIDAFGEGHSMGFSAVNTANFVNNAASVGATYRSVSNKLSDARGTYSSTGDVVLAAAPLAFTDDDRDEITNGTASTKAGKTATHKTK